MHLPFTVFTYYPFSNDFIKHWSLRLKVGFLFFLLPIILTAQSGPGGVGNPTNNALWLRGDAMVYEPNQAVNLWSDQSGNGNDVSQTNPAQQPIFRSNFINGYPMIEFDNVSVTGQNDFLSAPSHPSLDNTDGLTIFTVTRRNFTGNARSIISKRINFGNNASYMFFYWNSDQLNVDIVNNNDRFTTAPTGFGTGTNRILTLRYSGVVASNLRAMVYEGENLLVQATETSASIPAYNSPLVIGSTNIGDNRAFGGNMAEIIIYRKAVNNAERIIVNNYLSAKYDIPLTANDVYVMDEPANGNYDHEVAGIGRINATNQNLDAQGTGLVRIRNASELDDDEFLMWGHDNGIAEAVEFVDVPPLVEARFDRVWRVSERSPSGTPVDVGAIDIRVDLNGLGPVIASDLVLLVDTNGDALFADETPIAGATDLGGGIFEFSGVTALEDTRRFTIGTTNAIFTPLPVDLIKWEGICQGGKTLLTWTTASEKENDYFTIERSLDAKNWETVGKVEGAGNSEKRLEYEFRDLENIPGISYFRLKQTDWDGKYAYSRIIGVTCLQEPKNTLKITPNPSNAVFKINLSQPGNEIIIFDAMGKTIWQQQVKNQETYIDLSGYPSGIYFLKAWNVREMVMEKLVLER